MMLEIDESWLIDEFSYSEFLGLNNYSEPMYAKPVVVKNVRIDRETLYSRSNSETKVSAEGIVFCFASATDPFVTFVEQSKVYYDGKERMLKKVIPNYGFDNRRLWSYELEVL